MEGKHKMKAYYNLTATGYEVGSKPREGFTEYIVGSEPAELKALLDAEAQVQAIAHYKGLYLGVVQDKLKSLDYDSLATVKLWEGDATFGAEATRILTWYKGIITKNYALLTAGVSLTDEEYLAEINSVVF